MSLPFETTLALWFSPNAFYDWEPEPPAPDPANDLGEAPAAAPVADAEPGERAACIPIGLPAMRLVFKGVKWTAYPVFGMRENMAWEQVSQTHREADEQRRDDSRREARKPAPTLPDDPGIKPRAPGKCSS
jgi:hypothetical protein